MPRIDPSPLAETEWRVVSTKRPCPVCQARTGKCHRHEGGAFACCTNQPSEWPLTNGAWLHRVEWIDAPQGVRERRAPASDLAGLST